MLQSKFSGGHWVGATRLRQFVSVREIRKSAGSSAEDEVGRRVLNECSHFKLLFQLKCKILTIFILSSFLIFICSGSVFAVEWAASYGGLSFDGADSVQQTSDGGYIVAGRTKSFGAGEEDIWVMKLTGDGSVTWQKAYGGTGDDVAKFVQQTSDGGYIVAGSTRSFRAAYDIWVLKLTANGSLTWQKTYGGTDNDAALAVQQTSEGGYVVAGYTYSFTNGLCDMWVLKLTADGSLTWQKTYGGSGDDFAYSVQQTSDGGYIVAGYTDSFGAGLYDIWVLKLTANGSVTWQKTYSGTNGGGDGGSSIQQTSDGGYILSGYTYSFGAGQADTWVLKLTANGTITWQKTYGGAGHDFAVSVQETADGGYIVAGRSESFGAGDFDCWLLKLDASGNITAGCTVIGSSIAIVGNTSVFQEQTQQFQE